MWDVFISVVLAIADSIVQSAPWLIFGFFVAGLIHILIPTSLIKKWLSGEGFMPILRGSLIGVPLPLCSCSVIPVTRSLRASGASVGASASFLTSTPQIGIDSFIVTRGLLGLPMALIRVVIAFISALVAGVLVSKFSNPSEIKTEVKSCCQHNSSLTIETSEGSKISDLTRYVFTTLPNDLFSPLMTGFIISGFVSAFMPVQSASSASSVLMQVLFMLLISVPTYVCATSSVPVAQALILKGIHPAAVLVFLIGGPASNGTTIAATVEEFGYRGMLAYLFALISTTLTASLIVYYFGDEFFRELGLNLTSTHVHGLGYTYLDIASAIILCAVLLLPKIRQSLKTT